MNFQPAKPDQPYLAAQWKAPRCSVTLWNYLFGQHRIIVNAFQGSTELGPEPVGPEFCTYDVGRAIGICGELIADLGDLPELATPAEIESCVLAVAERHGGHDGGRVRLDQVKELSHDR